MTDRKNVWTGERLWDEEMLLDAADSYEEERAKWTTRVDKTEEFPFQVIRVDGDPVVHIGALTQEIADHELEIARGLACMKVALLTHRTEQRP